MLVYLNSLIVYYNFELSISQLKKQHWCSVWRDGLINMVLVHFLNTKAIGLIASLLWAHLMKLVFLILSFHYVIKHYEWRVLIMEIYAFFLLGNSPEIAIVSVSFYIIIMWWRVFFRLKFSLNQITCTILFNQHSMPFQQIKLEVGCYPCSF